MNSKRKILSAFLSFSLLLVSFGTFGLSAATVTERENNNSTDSATPISVNDTVVGNISSQEDVDYYKISVSERGYFNINFQHSLLSTDENARWIMTLYRDSNMLEQVYDENFYVNKKNVYTSKIGVEPGIYYIKLERYWYNGDQIDGTEYRLTVDFTASDYWESELNGDFSCADEISLNSTYGGFIENQDDRDFFKCAFTERGYAEIRFDHDMISTDENAHWIMTVYRDSDELIQVYDQEFPVNKKSSVTPKIGVEPGIYYVKLERYWYNGDQIDGTEYRLTVDFTASDYWESELNDDFVTADEISLNSSYGGFIENSNDKDFYKISFDQNCDIKIRFDHNLITTDEYAHWIMTVYKDNISQNVVYYGEFNVNQTSTVTPKIGVEEGFYYIKLERYWYNGDQIDGAEYKLTVLSGEQPSASDGVGDINGDNVVNSKDLTRMMKYIAGENVELINNADINGDGVVNSKDLTRLMKIIAGVLV